MKANQIIQQINNILNEGVYDPSIFKAIFMAGGGGSGKGFIVEKVVKGLGYKVVNTDDVFEFLMKKSGKSLDLGSYEDPTDYDPEREGGKVKTGKRQSMYIEGRLGLVIDGTADKVSKVLDAKKKLEEVGYDTYMIFVDTSLEVAKARNKKRTRVVPEHIVIEAWELAQANKAAFKTQFKNHIDIIDNSNPLEKDDGLITAAHKRVMAFSKLAPKSDIAKSWIKQELDKKKVKKVK